VSLVEALGASFAQIATAMKYHGSRWTKQYDPATDTPYYYDRATGRSKWERPPDFDEPDERLLDDARYCLREFYQTRNPTKIKDVDAILHAYRSDLHTLFQKLSMQYSVAIDCSWLTPGLVYGGTSSSTAT
jgi:hypothetical protein